MDYKRKKYEQGSDVTDARNARDAHAGTKPGEYQYAGQGDLDTARDQLMNRKQFDYNANSDPLYRQMQAMYMQQGRQAMQDTVAQSAALTGGYGNSWAQSAGQQAYNGYMQQLAGHIPQLYQMALDKYTREGDALRERYGMLAQDEDQAYNRYMASVDNWQREQDRLNDEYWRQYEADYGQYQDSESAAWEEARTAVEDERYDQQWQHDLEREAQEDARYDEQWQHQLDREAQEDEWRQKEWDEDLRRYEEGKALRGSGGGSGGSGGSGGGGSGRPGYGEMPTTELKSAMSQAKTRQDAKHLAEDMILEGVPEDMVMRLFDMYWNKGGAASHDKPTNPRPGPNKDMVIYN